MRTASTTSPNSTVVGRLSATWADVRHAQRRLVQLQRAGERTTAPSA